MRRTCLRVLETLPAPAARAPVLARVRARLAEVGPERLLDEVAPGLHYGPGVLDDVVLVTSPQVAPIVVELAEPDRTVIVHPPLGESASERCRLRDLGRALGDGTRMRVLQLLKGGERTLAELCDVLDAPAHDAAPPPRAAARRPGWSTCRSRPASRTSTGSGPRGSSSSARRPRRSRCT